MKGDAPPRKGDAPSRDFFGASPYTPFRDYLWEGVASSRDF